MTTKRKKKTTTTSNPPCARQGGGSRRGQRGVALILVLWTFAAIAVLAAEFARAMHDEAASTRNFKESTQARMIAVAGISEAVLALSKYREDESDKLEDIEEDGDPDPVRAMSHGDGQWVPVTFRGHPYEVRVIDESGRIALNKLDATQFRFIFENLDIEENDAEIIADSIIDWTDSDDEHQINGAESEYYEGLDRPYRAKNAWFDSVQELLLVRGVTHDIFYGHDGIPGLIDIFSVFNATRSINLNSVTPEVMQALGGYKPEDAFEMSKGRRQSGREKVIEDLRAALTPSGLNLRTSVPQQMTIESRVRDVAGRVVLAHIGAVLNLSSSGDGLRVYRWYDSIFDDSDETGGETAAGAKS